MGKNRRKLKSQSELHRLFIYYNGKLYWKISVGNRSAGVRAGRYMTHKPYRIIGLNGSEFLEHRIIFKMFYDKEPDYLDHINGIHDDNRIGNLQEISNSHNVLKGKVNKRNKTGYSGVWFDKRYNKYYSRLQYNNVIYSLGYHSTAKLANERREMKLNYLMNGDLTK